MYEHGSKASLPALKVANLPRIRFHDLPHTYASQQLDLGQNAKYIQKQMGHTSIKTTMDIYGHLMEDTNLEAASRLGEAIFGNIGSKMAAKNRKGPSDDS